ncbi:MAG: (2Fe-2S) ferredoxin domain-containing protein [Planctomycetota bacterium]|nr:(2Fe-2S) ferredoxin domain-containing protein [Planctomycetota bacterium]MCX8039589.1 (2Fe-2S) ferredoxin domain-containing protein [Planctomycetota bacterium]MDW8373120.1 (2Fe-2S) ferredoxin domain-containing protein [Planctomycetota bacterium]
MPKPVIEICLGSSCFARGSNRYPQAAARWLAAHGIAAELRGRRCRKACADGPIVAIDGVEHQVPDLEALHRALASLIDAAPQSVIQRSRA